jgi:hypothetical protein
MLTIQKFGRRKRKTKTDLATLMATEKVKDLVTMSKQTPATAIVDYLLRLK